MENLKLGFLGMGLMGSALANGIFQATTIKKENIYYYNNTKVNNVYNNMSSNEEVVRACDIIICAVKPYVAFSVLKDVKDNLENKLLVSICAGISIEKLEQIVGENVKIARVMPNMPCIVGESCSTFCVNKRVTDFDKKYIIDIFSSCGVIQELKEEHMDIATSLIGSGPAYVFLFIESLIDAGVKNGLPRDIAKKLILQTIHGSVELLNKSNAPVQELKDNICSPGGTTAVGLFTLEKNKFKFTVIDAIDKACEKSKSMIN